jgi:hypothetical protein
VKRIDANDRLGRFGLDSFGLGHIIGLPELACACCGEGLYSSRMQRERRYGRRASPSSEGAHTSATKSLTHKEKASEYVFRGRPSGRLSRRFSSAVYCGSPSAR